ncbi:signal peptidase I [Natrialbaceae archaeon A-gly3]
MTEGEILERGLGLLVIVVVALLFLGQLLGQPILLGYVATGSMEPTMDAGDGFIAIPSAVAGDVGEGDVVVFDARELHGGGLTTHRIVDETDDGYITAGDANPFTDQDSAEPPVTDGQIVAVALQVNGEVVTIPHLGTGIMAIHGTLESGYGVLASTLGLTTMDGDGVGSLLVGLGIALLGFGFLLDQFGPARRDANRSTNRENVLAVRVALAVILIVFVTLGTAAMVLPSGTTEYEVRSADDPTDNPQVLAPGETGSLSHTVDNAGLVPVVTVLEPASPGVEVEPERLTLWSRSEGETTVSLHAPTEPGEYTRDVAEHRYLLVAPPSVLEALHGVHPLVAVAAVNGIIVGVVVAVVLVLFGSGDLRLRSAGDHVPLATRLRRKLRK